MAVNAGKLIFVGACLLVLYTRVEKSMAQTDQSLSQQCLDCICEAASGCDDLTGCVGEVCGPYRITQVYWCDSGKPGLDGGSNDVDAFHRCVGERSCASRAVQGYMKRYARDCNGDGVIDCDDYALIHRLGCVGCNGTVVPEFQNAYEGCMRPGGNGQRSGGMQQGGSVQPNQRTQPGGSPQPNEWTQSGGGLQPNELGQPGGNMQTGCGK